MDMIHVAEYKRVVNEIRDLNWSGLDSSDMLAAAWAY